MPALDAFATQELEKLEKNQRLRALVPWQREAGAWMRDAMGRNILSFASNDYLGLSQHPSVRKAVDACLQQRLAMGAGASRLAGGNYSEYDAIEIALAQWKGTDAARVFGSGYLANIGVIAALMGAEDVIFADKLSHACMLDGARLSGAHLHRFAHNDTTHLRILLEKYRAQGKHALIMTEAVFSMDGDAAPLAEISALVEAYDAWLLVDVAHALAPLPSLPSARTVYVGTLSKTLGAYGGFAAGNAEVMEYLTSSARSLLFSTALPEPVIAAAHAALDQLLQNPTCTQKPMQYAKDFASYFDLPAPAAAIVPMVLHDESRALKATAALLEKGFYVPAIRPPTVPPGTSRLRFSFSALHEPADVTRLVDVLQRVVL